MGTVPGRDNTFDEHGRDAQWKVSQAGDRLGWNRPTGSHFPLPSGVVHELSSDYASQAGPGTQDSPYSASPVLGFTSGCHHAWLLSPFSLFPFFLIPPPLIPSLFPIFKSFKKYVWVFYLHVYMYIMYPQRPEERTESPGSVVTGYIGVGKQT